MKKFLVCCFIFLFLLSSTICYSMEINTKLVDKVIVLDVGHGGKDGGTMADGIYEKDLNLDIALKLQEALIKKGAIVYMTRDGDYDLSTPNASRRKKSDFDNRIDLINSSGADLYISIHINYLQDKSVYGAQTFYTENNKLLAHVIQESFQSYLKSPLEEKKIADSIYMYKQLKVPGVLIECGFLSNKNEKNLLLREEYQEKLVQSIVNALINYY